MYSVSNNDVNTKILYSKQLPQKPGLHSLVDVLRINVSVVRNAMTSLITNVGLTVVVLYAVLTSAAAGKF